MKVSEILALLNNKITSKDFIKSVNQEVNEYLRLSKKMGSTIPILVDEDSKFTFTEENYETLFSLRETNELDIATISYISDAILLSENIDLTENKGLFEKLEDFVYDFDNSLDKK